MKTSRASLSFLPIVLFLAGAVILLAGYYVYHKPITPSQAASLLRAFLDTGLSFLILVLAGGVGRRLLAAPGTSAAVSAATPGLARMAVQAALGLGLLGLGWLGLGLLGGFRVWIAWLVLAAGLVGLRRPCRAWLGEAGGLLSAWRRLGRLEKAVALLGLGLVLIQAWNALAPPLKWDALAYHLELPRQYIAAGGHRFLPQNPYWGQPQLVEMLYTWAMLLRGAETAAMLGWWVGILVLLGTGSLAGGLVKRLARPAGGGDLDESAPVMRAAPVKRAAPEVRAALDKRATSAGLVACACLLAGTTFRDMLAWSYTDLFAALMGLAGTAAFLAWLDSPGPERTGAAWLRWMGVFTGLAVSVKWTAGVLALGAILAAVLLSRRRAIPWNALVQAGLLSLLVYLPWMLRVLLPTGSLLFPFLFPTPWYSAGRLALAHLPPPSVDGWALLFLPITLTWRGVDSAAGFGTDLGPLLVLFALPGLWRHRRDLRLAFLASCLVVTWLCIGLLGARLEHLAQPRLYFAVLPALGICAGLGWDALAGITHRGVRLWVLAGAVVVLPLGLAAWQDAAKGARQEAFSAVLGTTSREEYLDRNLGWYSRAARSLADLPAGSRVLMLWEPRGYYASGSVQADPWIDRWRVDRAEIGSPQAIRTAWQAQGFTHVFLHQAGVDHLREFDPSVTAQDWAALDELLASLEEPVRFGDAYAVYPLP